MDIQNLVPVDYSNQRVLLTAQVAKGLACSVDLLKMLFKNHKGEFQEGVHFFNVKGGSLRALKERLSQVKNLYLPSSPLIGKFASHALLWTEQGVARLSKLIDTPQAWELFTALELHYFNPATHVAPPVEESLFPDEPVKAKKKRRPLPEYAVVYSALLDSALVKIGLTCDFNRRIKEVRKETGQDVEDVFTTDFMPLDDARKLESTVKAKFHDKNKGGELYDAPFEQVKTAIRDAPNDAFDKLIALAEKVNSPDEKDKLLIRAANLI